MRIRPARKRSFWHGKDAWRGTCEAGSTHGVSDHGPEAPYTGRGSRRKGRCRITRPAPCCSPMAADRVTSTPPGTDGRGADDKDRFIWLAAVRSSAALFRPSSAGARRNETWNRKSQIAAGKPIPATETGLQGVVDLRKRGNGQLRTGARLEAIWTQQRAKANCTRASGAAVAPGRRHAVLPVTAGMARPSPVLQWRPAKMKRRLPKDRV